MGEVYRARDTKLNRDVAIKVLPEAFARDPERMARFQREAEVLASLNHPNIAQIYGVEDRALVMELVEGVSPKGPMAFDDAWKIALQIADALEYAHERGVIHRDLKPSNVKVTPDGVVKLLDFGLAKAFSAEAGEAQVEGRATDSPTLTMGATVAGVILGTAAYMAPEQAKGKRVDKRADIWSWGVMLYELLTGERMFQGDDAAETVAAVIHKQPNMEQVPAQARKLLRRCLEKDPKKRLRDIGDGRELLEDTTTASPSRSGIAGWAVAGVLVIALGIPSFIYFRERPPLKTVLRYTIAAPENTTNLHTFAISPDGRLLVIAATVNGKRQLWLRALDSLQVRPVPGTDDAVFPFWSPDSRYIGFFAQGKLKKIAANGGPAQSLCDAPYGQGGSWSREGVIVFSRGLSASAIQRVSAEGGADVTVRKGQTRFPVFLPDGHHFLYLLNGVSPDKNGIYISSLDGRENRRVLADSSSVSFASSRLLFIRENTLMAQPFDAARGKTLGDAIPVAESVSFSTVASHAPVTASETGLLLYESGGVTGVNQMALYDHRGKVLGTIGEPGVVYEPAISPDEKALVFSRASVSGSDLWLRDLTRGVDQRFTTDASINLAPVWSPKADRIAFTSNRGSGTYNLYQKAASGTGQDELLLTTGNVIWPTQWSRDGKFIVYNERDPKTSLDIWVLPMDSGAERRPFPFLHSEFNESSGQLSPDIHWMAYTSDESGQREVYVRPFPAGEGQVKISIAGGEQPRWRGDGKELFFLGADGKMMAAAVSPMAGARPSFEPGAPLPLFEAHLALSPGNGLFDYDVTPDGKHFLLDTVAGGGSASARVLNVVVNWDAGLKK
jgi:Tol biopolymer transport system component